MWPAVLALIAGLLLCGLGAWQGSNLLGTFGGGGNATPTSSPTEQIPAVLPTDTIAVLPTDTPKSGQIVTGSPGVPSPEPFATDTPAPTPTETPVPVPPTDTPVPPPTETPALLPTQTPPPPLPTATFVLQPSPADTPVVPVLPTLPAEEGTGGSVALEDTNFIGGYFRSDGRYHGVSATWVYGQGTAYSTMAATFDLDSAPEGDATFSVVGLDSEDPGKTPISIAVNGTEIYVGGNPLPNDFATGINGQGNWGTASWTIPAGLLRPGPNTVSITNLSPNSEINRPPFFMLDSATITW
jgi:hypothetical protein